MRCCAQRRAIGFRVKMGNVAANRYVRREGNSRSVGAAQAGFKSGDRRCPRLAVCASHERDAFGLRDLSNFEPRECLADSRESLSVMSLLEWDWQNRQVKLCWGVRRAST